MKYSEQSKDFFKLVFEVVKLIPEGRVTSYGAIANCLGTPKSSRMVGWAMHASHSHPEYVPAHRVVNRTGLLTGKMHFSTPSEMQEKLEKEGHLIQKDQIQHFNKVFWDPGTEVM